MMKTTGKTENTMTGKRLCRFFLLVFLFFSFLIPLQSQAASIYEASDYFVAPQMWDNSARLQALVDKVHAEGGGTIQLAAAYRRISF